MTRGRELPAGLLVAALAACGEGTDGLATCELAEGYPRVIEPQTLRLIAPSVLALDGQGPRCDQLIRALGDPATRPPELAMLDGGGLTGTCRSDPTGRDILRLAPRTYDGQPLIAPAPGDTLPRQDVLAHVEGSTLVYLAGTVWPAGAAPKAGCLAASALRATVPGRAMGFTRFSGCQLQGTGEYTISSDDETVPGDAGAMVDAAARVRWATTVEVYVRPDRVTPELINSDAYCCPPGMLERCVGKRLYLDTHTGELVAQEPRCKTC